MERSRFVENFSKLPFAGKHGFIRPWVYDGRKAAAEGDTRSQRVAATKLAVLGLGHAIAGVAALKIGLVNVSKDTGLGYVEGAYDGLVGIAAEGAAYTQCLLANRVRRMRPKETITVQDSPIEPVVPPPQIETPTGRYANVPRSELLRDGAVTWGGAVLFILTTL